MRSQNRLALVSFAWVALLGTLGFMPIASAIPNPIDNGRGRKAELPDAPSTPPPSGNRQPGGSLSGVPAVCPQKPQKLTAITPANVHGKTLAGYPTTFWFYMPYTVDEVASGDFSILTATEDDRVYETSFELPVQPGFVSITLPADIANSLEEDQYYHWYLNVSCIASDEAVSDLNIDGWVQPVAAASPVQGNALSSDIWYDKVDQVASQLQTASPNDGDIRRTWADLLESVDLDEFTQYPVVGPVTLTDG